MGKAYAAIIIKQCKVLVYNGNFDSNSNGLTYAVKKFKGVKIAGHVTFVKGERSDLAQIAAELI